MECPHCLSDNREDRETCYVCSKDISTLRLVVNKARQHYNDALEHAERDRTTEAIDELKNALDLDASLVNAHVVLGTLYARQARFDEATQCWKNALALNPEMARAHDYLDRVESVQAVLPSLATYRRVALLLLVVLAVLAGYTIYALRPSPGAAALKAANEFIINGNMAEADKKLEQADILAQADSPVSIAAKSLRHTLALDLQQRIRLIQDLKYRQLYPEALTAMAELETLGPDAVTSASLATIREDISYYYRNMIAQLYSAYEQGDIDFATLQVEIERFVSHYPASPERTEIYGYLERAENLEVQAAMDELRRTFALDNNITATVEDLHELAPRFMNSPAFISGRSAFVEETLIYLFNLFTGYLDQQDFVRAISLLTTIESVSTDLAEMVDKVDISGAIELAWSVLRDAQNQAQLQQIENYIQQNRLDLAEDALWEFLQEPDLSSAEMGVVRSYWRRINRKDRLAELSALEKNETRYFDLQMTEDEANTVLELYRDLDGAKLPPQRRLHLLGLAAASAMRVNADDQATSFTTTLESTDKESTVTKTVRELLRKKIETRIPE